MTVTIKDIAEELGVAASTVSNVLNGRYKGTYPKTAARAEKIKAYAEKRGYRPSAAARAVRSQRTYQIGALLPNRPECEYTHPNAIESVLGLNAGLQATGYILSIIRFDDLTRDVPSQTRLFSEQSLDGLVVLGQYPEWVEAELRRLVSRIVWMDTNVWLDKHCIQRDETAAGQQAVRRAHDAGYRKAIWLGYPDAPEYQHYSHTRRRAGALSVAADMQMDVEQLELRPWGDMAEHWRLVAERLSPETAVIAESVYHAQALALTLGEIGLTAPGDFGLVCCDGSQEVDRLWPGLSRVTFDRFDMGRQAGEMIRKMIDNKRESMPSRSVEGGWVAGATLGDRR